MAQYTGKNLEEILEKVAQEKEVDVSELEYRILDEKKGVLGLGGQVTAEVYHIYDVGEFIFEYLTKFFTNLNQEVEVDVRQEGEDGFRVRLNASNNAILIGKNGQTLTAINTVVKSVTNSAFKKRYFVSIDINGYKENRYEKLKTLAFRTAKTVQNTHVTATMDPMSADERRVVHQYLNNMKNIYTESEGEGRDRRLKIIYTEEEKKHHSDL
ncbi:MAG: KH domain-containing protein [Erysipelotrichaceae bacterium]|jgi:spoIIIJ-associated protein|nr:KH domain-containing protein [Erysipelotrichaceae bacterium]